MVLGWLRKVRLWDLLIFLQSTLVSYTIVLLTISYLKKSLWIWNRSSWLPCISSNLISAQPKIWEKSVFSKCLVPRFQKGVIHYCSKFWTHAKYKNPKLESFRRSDNIQYTITVHIRLKCSGRITFSTFVARLFKEWFLKTLLRNIAILWACFCGFRFIKTIVSKGVAVGNWNATFLIGSVFAAID